MKNLKFNLHITNNCNYKCGHCFSTFEPGHNMTFQIWKNIIDNLLRYIPIKEFNIAGGEPLCSDLLIPIVDYINSLNLKCSIITNGVLMDELWIENHINKFSMVGFSIDSFDENTIKNIGRVDSENNFISFDKLLHLVKKIKKTSPQCKIKINTVVQKLNKNENINYFMKNLLQYIDRWKIFKMRFHEDKNFSNKHLDITFEEYENFFNLNFGSEFKININNTLSEKKVLNNTIIIAEKKLGKGYFFIDPNGYLLNNSGHSHKRYINCLKLNDIIAFSKQLNGNSTVDKELYNSRY